MKINYRRGQIIGGVILVCISQCLLTPGSYTQLNAYLRPTSLKILIYLLGKFIKCIIVNYCSLGTNCVIFNYNKVKVCYSFL